MSEEKQVIRRDAALLSLAQKIFGKDLVVEAFVCCPDYLDGKYTKEHIERAVMVVTEESTDKTINYHSETIRLVFSNGKVVEFWNSEWAGIGTVDAGIEDREI